MSKTTEEAIRLIDGKIEMMSCDNSDFPGITAEGYCISYAIPEDEKDPIYNLLRTLKDGPQ